MDQRFLNQLELQASEITREQMYKLWREWVCLGVGKDILQYIDEKNIKKVLANKIYNKLIKKNGSNNGIVRRKLQRTLNISQATCYNYIPRKIFE